MVFGGLGQNPFNPALTGRIVLLISFPALMTSIQDPLCTNIDALSGATILGKAKIDLSTYGIINRINIDNHQLLISTGGSLGDISPLTIIIGGLFLIYKRIISWYIPLSFIGTVFIFTLIISSFDTNITISPYSHIISGGLLFGAFYMATDYSTSPMY